MNKDMIKRILIYIAGILILALGLVLNAKTGLGVSPHPVRILRPIKNRPAHIWDMHSHHLLSFSTYSDFALSQDYVSHYLTAAIVLSLWYSY